MTTTDIAEQSNLPASLQHVNAKLMVKPPAAAALEAMIPVLHGWIQERGHPEPLPEQLPEELIDVADYRHVPAGPGLLLVGHEANYSLDAAGGRWGVRYNRKLPMFEATPQQRLRQAVGSALKACRRLEQDARLNDGIRFDGRRVEVFVNDRLLAPNTEATRAALESELRTLFGALFGGGAYTLTYDNERRRLFSATALSAEAYTTEALLRNLGK